MPHICVLSVCSRICSPYLSLLGPAATAAPAAPLVLPLLIVLPWSSGHPASAAAKPVGLVAGAAGPCPHSPLPGRRHALLLTGPAKSAYTQQHKKQHVAACQAHQARGLKALQHSACRCAARITVNISSSLTSRASCRHNISLNTFCWGIARQLGGACRCWYTCTSCRWAPGRLLHCWVLSQNQR